MKNRIKTWEIILAGFAFTALSIYMMAPAKSSIPNKLANKLVHGEMHRIPEAPSAPPSVTIKIEKLNKGLEKLNQLEKLDNLEQVKTEIKKMEKELEAASIELENISLPSLERLPEVLISTH